MRRVLSLVLAMAFGLLACGVAARASGDAIGTVARVQNQATATSPSTGSRVLRVGDSVYQDDRVATGADARLEITFADKTSLTLGANAAYEMTEFSFDGTGGAMTLDILSGTFAFVTGLIGQHNHDDVLVTTPVATIGIRGTRFWGGPIDQAYGVLILEGAVQITTNGGTVVLDQVGQGTTITSAAAAPSTPKQWGEAKKARALATVAFKAN